MITEVSEKKTLDKGELYSLELVFLPPTFPVH